MGVERALIKVNEVNNIPVTVCTCICSVIKPSFSFEKKSQTLDPSYKTDLDFWNGLGKEKSI